jgi:hypothetical protein
MAGIDSITGIACNAVSPPNKATTQQYIECISLRCWLLPCKAESLVKAVGRPHHLTCKV